MSDQIEEAVVVEENESTTVLTVVTEEVKPVDILESAEDDDLSWLNNEEDSTPTVTTKVSEDLGIKQRTLNFSKINPFVSFEIGGSFVMRIFPTEDDVLICTSIDANNMAAKGNISETLSYVLIKK